MCGSATYDSHAAATALDYSSPFQIGFSPFKIQSTPSGGALLDSVLPILKR